MFYIITRNSSKFQIIGVDPIGSVLADPEHSEISTYEVCNNVIGFENNHKISSIIVLQ